MSAFAMRAALKQLVPHALLERYRRLLASIGTRPNWHSTPERVFADVYARNLWGGNAGDFCSGSGSSTDALTAPYVEVVQRFVTDLGLGELRFVDLGCGDFEVGRRLTSVCRTYVGADVVADLIARNQARYGTERISFRRLDIVSEPLPEGDVCFLRQVLQHLSNAQIAQVLPKLRRYRAVVITEHCASAGRMARPNVDKAPGHHTRLLFGSGVCLTKPPFNLPAEEFETLLELSVPPIEGVADPGVIRTVVYSPGGTDHNAQ